MIRCRECGRRFNALTNTHLRIAHGLTFDQYRDRYPSAPLISQRTRETHRAQIAERQDSLQAAAAKGRRKYWSDPKNHERKSTDFKKMWEMHRERQLEAISQGQARFRSDAEKVQKRATKCSAAMKKVCADPDYRRTMRAAWTEEAKERVSRRFRQLWRNPEYRAHMVAVTKGMPKETRARITASMKARCADPEYREKMRKNLWERVATKWTRPERRVRSWLQQLGLYLTGSTGRVGFVPHGWLPIEGALSANGDFVDYNHKLVIHVDGDYWHGLDSAQEHDRKVNRWCVKNSWRYVRLRESDIFEKPKSCQRRILRLAEQVS